MSENRWKQLETIDMPTQVQVLEQAEKEGVLFPKREEITQDWIKLSQIYQALFGIFLIEKTGLDRLDERIAQRNISPALEEQKSYYQKYGDIGLRFFYLRCCARIERLSGEEIRLLGECSQNEDDTSWARAMELVDKTFQTVMTVDPEHPNMVYEPKRTLHKDYQVKGEEIPLVMRSVADFNHDGSLVSESAERERIEIFTNIWRQIDKALSNDLGCRTRTAVEVFEL